MDSSDVRLTFDNGGAILTATQKDKFETAQFELHQLLSQPNLNGVPLLVVCHLFSTMKSLFIKDDIAW